MTRVAAFSILIFYLISFTEFREVLRLPLLVEHYQEHKGKVAEMSFLDFLVMHYKTDVPHDDTDMSLPFKDCNHYFSISLVVLPTHKISLINTAEIISPSKGVFYLRHEPKLRAIDIFQPPRLV